MQAAPSAYSAEPLLVQEEAQADVPSPEPVSAAAAAAESPAAMEDVIVSELAGPEVEIMDAATPGPAQHWVAEPERVTDMDRAMFPAPAPAAAEAAPPTAAAVAAPEPEPSVDWADLLDRVARHASVSTEEAPAPAPELVASPDPAIEAAAPPSPEPVATPESVVAPPPQATGAVPDQATVRAAVEDALDKAMPNLKAVPGLLDTIVGEILRRLGGAS